MDKSTIAQLPETEAQIEQYIIKQMSVSLSDSETQPITVRLAPATIQALDEFLDIHTHINMTRDSVIQGLLAATLDIKT